MTASAIKKTYANPYVAGIVLGVVLFAAYFLTGTGLGASGAIARLTVSVQDVVAPRHVDRNAYLADMAGGDSKAMDHWIVYVTLGAFLGGFLSALRNRRLKVETQKGDRITNGQRWAFAFLGGGLMGFGARLARGCTSGQALSGGAVLSAGSWAFMLAVFAGGYAVAWFVRRLWT
jgi:uncharacterized membrane protein YedE/YeeE